MAPRSRAAADRANGLSWVAFWMSVVFSLPALFDLSREAAALGVVALTVPVYLLLAFKSRRILVGDPFTLLGPIWLLAVSGPILLPSVMPGYYNDPIWYKLSPWSIDVAALWMYRGLAGAAIAYWLVQGIMGRPRVATGYKHRENLALEARLRILIGYSGLAASASFVLMTGGQSYSHIEEFASFSTSGQIVHEVRQLSKVYVFLYFFARASGQSMVQDRLLIALTLLVYAVIFTASSSKIVALELGVMWALGSAAGAQSRVILKDVGLAFAALFLFYWTFYLVTAYRVELLQLATSRDVSLGQALSLQLEAIQRAFYNILQGEGLKAYNSEYGIGSMLDRLAYVSAFATVLEHSFGQSPYEHPLLSFLAPIVAFIPRALWEGKVQFLDSGTFAQMIGWQAGGFSITLNGSFYWAWGLEGTVIGMAVVAALLSAMFIKGQDVGITALLWRTMTMRLVLALIDIGLEFQAISVGMTRTFIFLIVIYYIASKMGVSKTQLADARLRRRTF